MNIKKMIVSAAVLLAVLAAACPFVLAASPITVSGGEVGGFIGAIVDVPINVSKDSGIAAIDLDITYDSNKLEYVSFEKGPASGDLLEGILVEAGSLKFAMIAVNGVNDEGAIVTLKFELLEGASGSVNIKIATGSAVDESSKVIKLTVSDGKVTVAGKVKPDNTVVDNNGSTVGTVNEQGQIVDGNGSQVGVAATDDTKSQVIASEQSAASALEQSVKENSGVAVNEDASGSGFKIEPWMIYTLLGIILLSFIVIFAAVMISKRKKRNKEQDDSYEKVYDRKDDGGAE